VSYPFGRTWQARANYRRGLEYVADLPVPVYATGATAAVEGLITRRIDVAVLAGYSSGQSILNLNNLAYDTYTGTLRMRYAWSRNFAVFADYLYYYYDFGRTTGLASEIPSSVERNGVRVGLSLWMPTLRLR
jgi:hypothetical protein